MGVKTVVFQDCCISMGVKIVIVRLLVLVWVSRLLVQSSISGAFLEVDAIFNPGKKHVIEAQQKETIEKKEDGDMYKKDKPYLSKLKSKDPSDKKT